MKAVLRDMEADLECLIYKSLEFKKQRIEYMKYCER